MPNGEVLYWLDVFGVLLLAVSAALTGALAFVGLIVSGSSASATLWAAAILCFAVRAAAIVVQLSLLRRAPQTP